LLQKVHTGIGFFATGTPLRTRLPELAALKTTTKAQDAKIKTPSAQLRVDTSGVNPLPRFGGKNLGRCIISSSTLKVFSQLTLCPPG
jgi:hypothetical protein